MPDLSTRPFLVSGEGGRDLGQIPGVLADTGRSLVFVERWRRTDVVFAPELFAGLIILGDGNHWATSKRYERDRDWLGKALNARRPVLGICFGAQLLAAYLAGITSGRSLAKHPINDHVGKIAKVAVRGEGLADPVIEPLRWSPQAVMSHEDFFQEPAGAVGLAWSVDVASEHCEAFRVGPPEDVVYGLQFHPEPTLEMLQNDKWFDPVPNADRLQSVVITGRQVLEEWVKLATSR